MSQDSCDSREREPVLILAADVRRRLTDSVNAPTKSFQRDPEDPSAAALKVTRRRFHPTIPRSLPYPGAISAHSIALKGISCDGALIDTDVFLF